MKLASQDDGIQDRPHLACASGLVTKIIFAAHHREANVAFGQVVVHGDLWVTDEISQTDPVGVHTLQELALRVGNSARAATC